MGRIVALLLTIGSALPLLAQGVSIEVTKDSETVRPGDTTTITVTVSNKGTEPATGRFFERLFLETNLGMTVESAGAPPPVGKCTRQGILGRNEIWDCFCDPVTIPPGGSITTTVVVRVPAEAAEGSKSLVGATVQMGQQAVGQSTYINVGSPNGPRLRLRVRRDPQIPEVTAVRILATYSVFVSNVGNAPTEGPIDVEFNVVPGLQFTLVASQFTGTGPAGWQFSPGPTTTRGVLRTSNVILPDQELRLEVAATFISMRGEFPFQARVSGGGSSSHTSAVDQFTVDARFSDLPFENPPPTTTNGRPR